MNIEHWIGSVINLSSVPCFGVCGQCGNISTVFHNTSICTNVFTDCSASIINCVIYVIFTFAVYDTVILVSLSSLCCTFHVLVHHIEETIAIALLFYIIVMN